MTVARNNIATQYNNDNNTNSKVFTIVTLLHLPPAQRHKIRVNFIKEFHFEYICSCVCATRNSNVLPDDNQMPYAISYIYCIHNL